MTRTDGPRLWRGGGWWSLALLLALACSTTRAPSTLAPDAGAAADPVAILRAISEAADVRRAADIPQEAGRSRDPLVRRAQARALARILDDEGTALLRALDDEDGEVVAWAAYGLGESCKGHEDRASALVARLASLAGDPTSRGIPVLLRALGRCATDVAESALRPWLRAGTNGSEAASFALGDVAARRGGLSAETTTALLDAASGSVPLAAALYPFSRSDVALEPVQAARLRSAARSALMRPGPFRLFAIRILGRLADSESSRDVAGLLQAGDATGAERVEAVHSLARMSRPGQGALADALAALGRAHPGEIDGTDHFNLLLSVVESLATAGVALAEVPLWNLARLEVSPGTSPARVRRVSMLRCAAAAKLARGAWESEVLLRCDLGDGEVGERARLAALAQEDSPLNRARRAALSVLARSAHVRVREAALDVVVSHPETGDVARSLLAQALAANEPGVVAKAADLVHAHTDRVFVLAPSERRAALDPSAPPPSATPARELDGAVAAALRAALAHPWAPDLVETRAALVEAALATGLPEGQSFAAGACRSANATLRARTAKALSSAGVANARCRPPDDRGLPAREIGRELTAPIRIALDTDAGSLVLALDPVDAPVTVTRLAALARAGFYTGTSFHRVVPGYLAQFGDPGGDGYGGSGELLRCETSPRPFERGDVGVALAGRDTGSSQLFVALSRYPSLDGQYTWVGRTEGDWDAVAEGDLIRAVRVEPP
jgi:cyclophilin family peptidyl-prolyl cis-trans isomerase